MRYRQWLLQLFVWDGLLPLLIINFAVLLSILIPKPRWIVDLAAVFIPIIGFFVRMRVAYAYAEENQSNGFQYFAFWIALFLLMLLDAVLILFLHDPRIAGNRDWNIWLMLYSTYLLIIGFALFPFDRPELDDQES